MNDDIEKILFETEMLYMRQSRYAEDDWHSMLHTHYFTEIIYILSGQGYFIVDNKKTPIKTNDIVVVNPYIQHTESSSGEYPLWYVVIGISNIQFEKSQQSQPFYLLQEHLGSLLPIIKIAIHEMNHANSQTDALLKRLAEFIVIKLLSEYGFSLMKVENKSVSKDSALIKDFIDRHYKEACSLEEIADHLHLDKYYIIHIFKKNFGDTPMSYMLKQRLKNAKELLVSTDYSISEIAYINGFSSQSYFNQAFKKEVQLSPVKYRKLQRGID